MRADQQSQGAELESVFLSHRMVEARADCCKTDKDNGEGVDSLQEAGDWECHKKS